MNLIQRLWKSNSTLWIINIGKQISVSSVDTRDGKKAIQPSWMKRREKLYLENHFLLTRFGRSLSAERAEVHKQPHKVHASAMIGAFEYLWFIIFHNFISKTQ